MTVDPAYEPLPETGGDDPGGGPDGSTAPGSNSGGMGPPTSLPLQAMNAAS